MKIDNQQQSPEKGNVQRLSREGVGSSETIETENTLPSKVEGEDIVQNLKRLKKCKTKDQYLDKIYTKYGNKFTFDFSNWTGITGNKIKITCPIHGEFEQVPRNLLLSACKTGCKKCGLESKNKSKTKDFKNFIDKANVIHNNNYTYIEQFYINRKSKVRIICKEHGEFIKSAQKHLSGQGCFECKIQDLIKRNILIGGYSEDLFKRKPELKNIKACLYYISINNGRLYKIGISTTLKTRMRGIKCKAKNFVKSMDLLWSCEDTLYNCFKKEQEILNKYSNKRVFLKWSTELFSENVIPIKLNNLN